VQRLLDRFGTSRGEKTVITDQIKSASISEAISVEKIAAMKAKFMARQRKMIPEIDEPGGLGENFVLCCYCRCHPDFV